MAFPAGLRCKWFRGLVVTLATVWLGGCETPLLDQRSDIELTWDKALVYLPPVDQGGPLVALMESPRVAAHVARYAPGTRLPVVVYMHGCTGLGNFSFLRELARQGFAVVAPDSLARRFRPLQCDPRTRSGGYNVFVYDFRVTEVAYASHRLQSLPWVDRRNLFLVGTSEGAVATALYRGDEFSGRVITQWTCHGARVVEGVAAPPETPILSIVRSDDPWYGPERTVGQQGDCGVFLEGRPKSRSVVLRGAADHDVFDAAATANAIFAFLDELRTR
jgi:dienelactone hydrolase